MRPEWIRGGQWSWVSVESDGYTALRVPAGGTKGGYQHIVMLDWAEYDGDPKHGRKDAEELAAYIVDALNRSETV